MIQSSSHTSNVNNPFWCGLSKFRYNLRKHYGIIWLYLNKVSDFNQKKTAFYHSPFSDNSQCRI